MTRAIFAAPAVAALLAAALPAQADETFDLFQKYCADTNADPDKAVALADKAGWMPLPTAMLGKLQEQFHGRTAKARMHSTEAGMTLLMALDGTIPVRNLTGRFCVVMTFPPQNADFEKQVASYAAVPVEKTDDASFYAWKVEAGRHVPVNIKHETEIKSLIFSGGLNIVMTKRDAEAAGIIMMIPTSMDLPSHDARGKGAAKNPKTTP